MSWIKFAIWLLMIWTIFATVYFTNTLQTLSNQISVINTKFFVYVPIEYRYLFTLFIFLIVTAIIYKWWQRT